MTTRPKTTDASPNVVVSATGRPTQPARFFAIYVAATTSVLFAGFILYRVGIPFIFAFSLILLMLFIKTKALQWMEPQRISARSRPDGTVLVQGKFRERTIPRNSEATVETLGIGPDGSLSIALAGSAQPVTLDTEYFRLERLQALEQLFNAMLGGEASAIETVADRHELKAGGRNGNKVFMLWEKPNAVALNVGASAASIGLFLALQAIAS